MGNCGSHSADVVEVQGVHSTRAQRADLLRLAPVFAVESAKTALPAPRARSKSPSTSDSALLVPFRKNVGVPTQAASVPGSMVSNPPTTEAALPSSITPRWVQHSREVTSSTTDIREPSLVNGAHTTQTAGSVSSLAERRASERLVVMGPSIDSYKCVRESVSSAPQPMGSGTTSVDSLPLHAVQHSATRGPPLAAHSADPSTHVPRPPAVSDTKKSSFKARLPPLQRHKTLRRYHASYRVIHVGAEDGTNADNTEQVVDAMASAILATGAASSLTSKPAQTQGAVPAVSSNGLSSSADRSSSRGIGVADMRKKKLKDELMARQRRAHGRDSRRKMLPKRTRSMQPRPHGSRPFLQSIDDAVSFRKRTRAFPGIHARRPPPLSTRERRARSSFQCPRCFRTFKHLHNRKQHFWCFSLKQRVEVMRLHKAVEEEKKRQEAEAANGVPAAVVASEDNSADAGAGAPASSVVPGGVVEHGT